LARCATNLETWHFYKKTFDEYYAEYDIPWLKILQHFNHLAVQLSTYICGTEHVKLIYDQPTLVVYVCSRPPIHDPPRGPVSGLPGCAHRMKMLGSFCEFVIITYFVDKPFFEV
jgi:hypothetical protein